MRRGFNAGYLGRMFVKTKWVGFTCSQPVVRCLSYLLNMAKPCCLTLFAEFASVML